ncbi:hypothetical protein [Corallococcus carmarthensis]|nr:hypothetical protein [Corallococcus carmarthensis]NOK16242.1 hypothetical protein [Corallococcus carmarthensis]
MRTLSLFLMALTCALFLPACGEPDCTPESCADGCCSASNLCIRDRGDALCGPNGGLCEGCPEGNVCRLDTKACYAGVMRTRVQPRRAVIADVDPDNGEDWDSDGSPPDVVVEMRCPSAPELSRTAEDESWDPEWRSGSCEVISSNLLDHSIEISIFDNDDFALDDEFGTIHYQVTRSDLNRGRFEIAIPPAVQTLVFDLTHTYSPQ